jgi:Tfp pilus assembly protein PilF
MRLLSEIRNYMGNYHVKSGAYHYYRSEFSQAIAFLRKALADEGALAAGDRENARAFLTLAFLGLAERMAAEGDAQGGIEELRNAAGVSPHYPDVHFTMARLYERAGQRDDAVRAYRKAIECNGGYLEARVALAGCLLAAGQVEDATAAYRAALDLRLKRLREPFERGIEDLQAGRVDAALASLHQVFFAAPRLCEEHMRKALEWMRGAEHERALHELDRAIEACPRYPDLHNLRGIVLCDLERPAEAVAAFRRSAELCPGHNVPLLNLAFAQIRANRPDEAEAELESILARDPLDAIARASLDELRSGRLAEKRGSGTRS